MSIRGLTRTIRPLVKEENIPTRCTFIALFTTGVFTPDVFCGITPGVTGTRNGLIADFTGVAEGTPDPSGLNFDPRVFTSNGVVNFGVIGADLGLTGRTMGDTNAFGFVMDVIGGGFAVGGLNVDCGALNGFGAGASFLIGVEAVETERSGC